MNKVLFTFRFSYRNLTVSLARSLLMMFALFVASTILLIVTNTHHAFYQVHENRAIEQYGPIDIVITYDSNSTSRLVNQRIIAEKYATSVEQYSVFFNFYTLATFNNEVDYVQVFSSNDVGYYHLFSALPPTLSPSEMVITDDFAISNNLVVNSSIELSILGESYVYTVKEIVPQRYMFSGKSIYINKNDLLHTLFSLPQLNNLGNTLYLNVLPHVNIDDFLHDLQAEAAFESYYIFRSVDPLLISQSTNYYASVLFGIGLFGLFAIGYVIHSLIPLFKSDYQAQLGVVKSLGQNITWMVPIWLSQFAIYLLVIPLSVYSAQAFYQESASRAGVFSEINLHPILSAIAIAILIGFVILEFFTLIHSFSRHSSVSQSLDKRRMAIKPSKVQGVVLLVFLILLHIFNPFSEGVQALLLIVVCILLSLYIIDHGFYLWNHLLKKKKNYFHLVSLPLLKESTVFHNAMKVTVLSIIIILIALTTSLMIDKEIVTLQNQTKVDYYLSNLFDYSPSLKEEIALHEEVEQIDEAIIFRHIVIDVLNKPKKMSFMVSTSFDKLQTYFDFTYIGNVSEAMNDSQVLAVLLPISLAKAHQLQIGDFLDIQLGDKLGIKTFMMAGFIDTDYDNIMITNLFINEESRLLQSVNGLLVNTIDGGTFKQDMIRTYSSQMMVVIDLEEMTQSVATQVRSLVDFAINISIMLVIAFGIVIMNNSRVVFYQLKSEYTVFLSLGLPKKQLLKHVFIEFVMMSLLIGIVSIFILVVALPNLGSLMLLVGFYKVITFEFTRSLGYIVLGILVFFASYFLFVHHVSTLKIINEIKKI
ncbi:MAG: ABC transporter permease [bacterium]|nr:ABC transporter permease [bacterium]